MEQVVQVSTSILHLAAQPWTFKDAWVNVSDDYQCQLVILESRLNTYQEQVRIHNPPGDSSMVKILENAEATLQKAVSRLSALERFAGSNRCCSHIRLWCAKLNLMLFPENLEKILEKVNDDIDSILKVLNEEGDIASQAREAARRRAMQPSTRVGVHLYVPLVKAQSAIIDAIESQNHQLVLLYGGVGKGKSTLAKFVCLQYEIAMANGGQVNDRKYLTDVIWVACANCSRGDVSAKQLEILRDNSPNTLGSNSPEEENGQEKRISQALQKFLSDREVLIVLDDVSDRDFLHDMWRLTSGGSKVQYLVASQTSNICSSLESQSTVLIHMGDPSEDEATRILASLVGLKDIPENLKVIVGKIIQDTDRNPLALACLASHFAYGQDNKNRREWQNLLKGLYTLLRSYKEEKIVLDSTPRSLWVAMKICIENLETAGSKKILFLMYLCKGGSVPEAVLRILHSSSTFLRSRNELVDRELLTPEKNYKNTSFKTNPAENDGVQESKTYWSLVPLVKHYIIEYVVREKEKGEIRSMLAELLGDDGSSESDFQYKHTHDAEVTDKDEARVAVVLCALYFDPSHEDSQEIVKKALTRTSIAFSNDPANDLRRQAVESLVWLLDKPESEGIWTDVDVGCVRKVLLMYICDCQFDDKNITHLLKLDACPNAQLATLEAITQICFSEDKPLFGKGSLNFLQALAHLVGLNEGISINVQLEASKGLHAVCLKASRDNSARLIIDTPGVLDIIVNSLSVPNQRSALIPGFAASCLWNLSWDGGVGSESPISGIILNREGVLPSLVKGLSKHDTPGVQRTAAGALAALAFGEDFNKIRIANEQGTINGLVKLLSAQDNPQVQAHAALAFWNLAGTEALRLQIANQEGALVGLVKSLAAYNNPDLQRYPAGALASLSQIESIAFRIYEEGALDSLVKLLSAQDNPEGQAEAARALWNVAGPEAVNIQIANQEGALAALSSHWRQTTTRTCREMRLVLWEVLP